MMLLCCSKIKNNSINLDINIANITKNTNEELKLFIKQIEKQSIFHYYHKIGMVINTIVYFGLIILIALNINKNNTNIDDCLSSIFTICGIIFVIFINSLILYHNTLYFDNIGDFFVNMMFIFFIIFIVIFILCIIFLIWSYWLNVLSFNFINKLINKSKTKPIKNHFSYFLNLFDYKYQKKPKVILIKKLTKIFAISLFIITHIIFVFMNVSIFINIININILMVVFFFLSVFSLNIYKPFFMVFKKV